MKKPLVLLVEDEELIRSMYSQKLSREGLLVAEARDGKEAVNYLKNHIPSIILIDILLPKLNGLQVITAIKKNPKLKKVPIIVVTNLNESDSNLTPRLRASLGISAYYVKSRISPSDLVSQIKALVNQ